MSHHWHSIRPWTPRLVIHAESQSVAATSATFVLSPADESHVRPIAEILANGVAVTINDQNWQRVVMHIDEAANEAIVLVFGLMPGHHYDIELRVDAGESDEPALAVSNTIDTVVDESAAHEEYDTESPSEDDDDDASTVPSVSAGPTTLTPPATPPHEQSPSAEETAAQIRTTISSLSTEQSSLSEQLKLARRDLQRAEAALRAEIDTLKRASEKANAAEIRSKQKVLALQEAVKQSLAATSDAKAETTTVEREAATLRARERELEAQVQRLREEAAKSRALADEAVGQDNRRLADAQAELSTAESRGEKLFGKRDKLQELIPELETRLTNLRQENDALEVELAPKPIPRLPLAPGANLGSIWSPQAPPSRTVAH
ncbi:hypothetical protein BKA62DRAFT_432217 [Auriculariales sp. MPI-PUGE-AT-0066]|nr:hypothetical protein BKA62DRAFT_432217 [Auriculariales sp. MPI-PUGE-AT-0066]